MHQAENFACQLYHWVATGKWHKYEKSLTAA